MEVIVPVRLTEEDVTASTGEYYDALELKSHNKLRNSRIFSIVFGTGYLIIMFSLGILPILNGGKVTATKIAPFVLQFVLSIFFLFSSVQSARMTKKALIQARLKSFHNDCTSMLLCHYTLSSTGIFVESRTQSSILNWDEVYHLTEYPSCFSIEKSPLRKYIIPRRCFENDQQIRDFRSIVSSNLPASKWSLTGIPLGISKLDRLSSDSVDVAVLLPDPKDCIYSFTFEISEKEASALNFALYRSGSFFKKFIVYIALMSATFICIFADSPLSLAIIFVAEILIILQIFFLFRKVTRKVSLADKTFWLEETVSFFPDRIVIETKSEHLEYFWNTLSRIKITRAGLLVFPYAECAMLFPASALNRMPNKQAFLAFIKSRKLASRK